MKVSYNKIIDNNFSITTRMVIPYEKCGYTYSSDRGTYMKIRFAGRKNEARKIVGYMFEWLFQGSGEEDIREEKQVVEVAAQPSNLGKGTVYYFVCPVTGCLCRKLYLLGGRVWLSRRAFPHIYSSQTIGGRWNRLKLRGKDPYRKHGKPYYKGKLTPYGKRMQRYDKKLEDDEVYSAHFLAGLNKILYGTKFPTAETMAKCLKELQNDLDFLL